MKNLFNFLFLAIFLHSCSFDNKTGIWKDANQELKKSIDNSKKKKISLVFKESEVFNNEKDGYSIIRNTYLPYRNKNWSTEFYNQGNRPPNLLFDNKDYSFTKFETFNKLKSESHPIINNGNVIYHDKKGFIYAYSIDKKEEILKYNFYKKKFKNNKKKISLIVNNKIIYAADNLGFIYSIDINSRKVLWAKNFGIPFRSEIKIINEQLFVANQDNILFSLNPLNGDVNWQYSSSLSALKSNFINSIVGNKSDDVFFLNTNGELYSIDTTFKKVNWVLNFQESLSNRLNEKLFYSLPLVADEKYIYITLKDKLIILDVNSGIVKLTKSISLSIPPIVLGENVFLINKNNLIISIDISNGNIDWSKNILNKIQKLGIKKHKIGKLNSLLVVNNYLQLTTNNGHFILIKPKDGSIYKLNKFKNKIAFKPLILNGSIFLFEKNKKMIKIN